MFLPLADPLANSCAAPQVSRQRFSALAQRGRRKFDCRMSALEGKADVLEAPLPGPLVTDAVEKVP
jgi:hypothetical protein